MIHLKNYISFFKMNESISVEKLDSVSYENETVTSLPYNNLIEDNRQAFLKKITRVAKDIGVKPIWLMHVIFNESEFDPKKVDRITGAVGLLSFLPSVIRSFVNTETGKNYTPNDVLQMTNTEQLDLVRAFYKSWIDHAKIKKPISPGDFAALTFYPGVIKKDWDWGFPTFVIEKNPDLFKSFASENSKTKKDYYEYADQILNSEKAYDSTNNYLLGNFSGAIAEPNTYDNKKPLEFYKDLLLSLENPVLSQQINSQDAESTEKSKQIG